MYYVFVNDKPIVLTTEDSKEDSFKNYLLDSVNIGKVIAHLQANEVLSFQEPKLR